jgi:hypothetical protein
MDVTPEIGPFESRFDAFDIRWPRSYNAVALGEYSVPTESNPASLNNAC